VKARAITLYPFVPSPRSYLAGGSATRKLQPYSPTPAGTDYPSTRISVGKSVFPMAPD
jgi:hypothetical protein